MKKSKFIILLSKKMGLTQAVTEGIVNKILDVIIETLVKEGRIELRDFGVFEVRRRVPRKVVNSFGKIGVIELPEKFVAKFVPSKYMMKRIKWQNS